MTGLERLMRAKTQSVEDQQRNEREIREAFRVWWATGPGEEEFSMVMGGVVLSAGMLYILGKGGPSAP